MGIGFAHKHKIEPFRQDQLAHGLSTVQIIPENGYTEVAELIGVRHKPSFSGVGFTVLLIVAILGDDEFRRQGNSNLVGRVYDYGCNGAMGVGHGPITFSSGTIWATDLFGGEILSPIYGDQQVVLVP